ncbi:MAG: retroviral-like aspartic protease family protein [Gammaproteobacteria bacterium]|nr:retroviral-like aspartic protease family protein [Gammaproteobacteria bacterium]
MSKIITLVSVLSIGVFVGWNSHTLYSSYSMLSQKVVAMPVPQNEDAPKPEIFHNSETQKNPPEFFSSKTLLDNAKLGVVIDLIKQDLDLESQNQLNKDVIRYAKSLLVNTANGENTEQRLLALLGNEDTKDSVLDVLARFYAKREKYEQAISSLYKLRSMAQFDEEYRKITSRISVLTRKNLKQLQSYNYRSETVDFFDFLIANEPDNFSIQMQYAQFEYKNRNYSHVEELLSVLAYHPDYSTQSQSLLQKSRHQKDMIENGIIPVPVEKKGDHYVVSAVINNQEPVKLIIDTGATMTVLSPKVIKELGLRLDDVQQHMTFSTANGVVRAPILMLDSIRIQNHLVNDLQVGVLSAFSHSEFSGLLGMNFLSQFAFFIDQKNSTLELVDVE